MNEPRKPIQKVDNNQSGGRRSIERFCFDTSEWKYFGCAVTVIGNTRYIKRNCRGKGAADKKKYPEDSSDSVMAAMVSQTTRFDANEPFFDGEFLEKKWESSKMPEKNSNDALWPLIYYSTPPRRRNYNPKEAMEDMRGLQLLWGLTFFNVLRADDGVNKLKEKYFWKEVDFAFPSAEARAEAIESKKFIPSNTLPLGVDVWNGRTFVTLPKWKPGIPATLAVIPKNSDSSPLLYPYPNWKWHSEGNCNGLTSVFRISVDECGRLWVLDSGVIDVLNTTTQLCPSQIVVFDLKTDKLIWRYRIPKDQIPEGTLFTNIVTDIRNNKCDEAYAYAADVLRYGLVVYNWKEDNSWRISHNYFFPDPIACRYKLNNISFSWTDGIFGLALSPLNKDTQDRFLYFHPMSSYREFSVPTSILRNNSAEDFPEEFKVLGEPRGLKNYHSSASGMDRNGILFYNLVTQDAVGCWNSNRPYKRSYQGIAAQNSEALNFPNDLKVDHERRQNLWVLSNKLHKYLYTSLNPEEVNFRVLTGRVEDIVRGTVCDPSAEPLPETDNRIAECLNAEL